MSLAFSRFLLLATVFFLINSTAISQDVLQIYREHLPPNMRSDAGLAFSKPNLESLTEIDPSLVYFFIVSMEVRGRDGESPLFNETQQAVAAYRTEARRRRQTWAAGQYAAIGTTSYDPTVREKARSVFVRLSETEVRAGKEASFPLPIDVNRRDFFTLLYHLRDGSIEYHERVDYSSRLRSVEDSLRTVLMGGVARASGDLEVQGAADKLLERWYLFDDRRRAGPLDVQPVEAVLEAMSRSYAIVLEDFDPWRISVGMMVNSAHAVEHVYLSNPVLNPGSATLKLVRRQMMASVGYRVQLKSVRTLFSHVAVQFVYLAGQGSDNMIPHIEKFEMRTESAPPPYVTAEHRSAILSSGGSLNVGGLHVYALEVSSPLAYVTPRVSIETSFIVGISIATYDIAYAYDYSQVTRMVYPNGTGTTSAPYIGSISEDRSSASHRALFVRPALQLVVQPIRHLQLTASVTHGLAGFSVAALF